MSSIAGGRSFAKSELAVRRGLLWRFKNFPNYIEPMVDCTPQIHQTIGDLDDEEMKATKELRTTSFVYKQTENNDDTPLGGSGDGSIERIFPWHDST